MADKKLSSVIGGADGGVALAPDLTFFSTKSVTSNQIAVTGIDASSALTEVLGLTGRFIINKVSLSAMIANDLSDIRLTIDGVVIWDETGLSSNGTTEHLIGSQAADEWSESIICETSFSLEVQMSTDNAIDITYNARPIL